jgi:membrane protein YdbS with pleckstrin-like domain
MMVSPSSAPPGQPPSSAVRESKQLLGNAERLLSENKLQESEAAFTKVIALAVDASQGFYGLGLIQFRRARYADAATMFQGCLRLDPMNANAYYYLGESWERLKVPGAAVAFFEKALSINPGHRGALEKLSSRAASGSASAVQPLSTAPHTHPAAAPSLVPGGGEGVYEYIRSDTSPLAKQTLQLIDSVKLVAVAPRLSAFLGKILLTPALWFIALMGASALLGNAMRHDRQAQQLVSTLVKLALVLPFGIFLYEVVRVKTTKYTLDKGRLMVSTGIFSKEQQNIELYRIEDIQLHQTFLNRLTQDGELILHVATGHTQPRLLKLRGLAKINQLQVLFDQLRSLIVLLRTGQWGKGIIY